jgi:hypothetical protein
MVRAAAVRDDPSVQRLCALHGYRGDPVDLVTELCGDLAGESAELPVDLDYLASLRHIRRPLHIDMAEAGSIHYESSSYVVRLRAADSRQRRRFTFAHEIVHTFFLEADAESSGRTDEGVGEFKNDSGEEYLCDVGAAELLLPREPFTRVCPDRPVMSDVVALASLFDSSIEATARRVVALTTTPLHMVVLQQRLKPTELRRMRQRALPGLESPLPEPRLRVAYAVSNRKLYIPQHKSPDPDSPLADSLITGEANFIGHTGLTPGTFEVSAQHLPYRNNAGHRVERVIALLRPALH